MNRVCGCSGLLAAKPAVAAGTEVEQWLDKKASEGWMLIQDDSPEEEEDTAVFWFCGMVFFCEPSEDML